MSSPHSPPKWLQNKIIKSTMSNESSPKPVKTLSFDTNNKVTKARTARISFHARIQKAKWSLRKASAKIGLTWTINSHPAAFEPHQPL